MDTSRYGYRCDACVPLMGARAGRKGSRTYNILTCGVGSWRKYLDKKRRKAAKRSAVKEEMEAWQQAAAEAYYRVEETIEEQQCICGLVTPNPKACQCGCGFCCPPDCECEEEEMTDSTVGEIERLPKGCPHGCHISAACSRCEEIRAAVAEQREKDASVDPQNVSCLYCQAVAGEFCTTEVRHGDLIHSHNARWRTAIRAGDPEPKEGGDDDED